MSWQAAKQEMAFELEQKAWKLYCEEKGVDLPMRDFMELSFEVYDLYMKKASRLNEEERLMNSPFKLFIEIDGKQEEVTISPILLTEAFDLYQAHGAELSEKLAAIIGRRVLELYSKSTSPTIVLKKVEGNEE